MATNGDYPQKNLSVEIPIHLGVDKASISHAYDVLTKAFSENGISGYKFVHDGNGTLTLTGEGPYRKTELLKVVKEAMLKDISSKNKEKSPLRSSLEKYCFYRRQD